MVSRLRLKQHSNTAYGIRLSLVNKSSPTVQCDKADKISGKQFKTGHGIGSETLSVIATNNTSPSVHIHVSKKTHVSVVKNLQTKH